MRKLLVDWIKEVGGRLLLSKATIHIAVAYLDYVLGKQDMPRHRLCLVAVTCLYLAAKYDELDRNIPNLNDLLRASSAKLSAARPDDIKECEVSLLRTLSWSLRIITPLVFAEVLLTQGVVHKSDKVGDNNEAASSYIAKVVSQQTMNFVDQALYGTKHTDARLIV